MGVTVQTQTSSMKKTSPYMGTVPGPRRRLYNREEGGNDRGVQRGQGVSSHLPKIILKIILATAILFIVIFLLFIIIQRNTNPEHGGRALGPNHSIGSLIGDSHLEDKVKQFKTKKDCRRSVGRGDDDTESGKLQTRKDFRRRD